jgi:hypothetical protein
MSIALYCGCDRGICEQFFILFGYRHFWMLSVPIQEYPWSLLKLYNTIFFYRFIVKLSNLKNDTFLCIGNVRWVLSRKHVIVVLFRAVTWWKLKGWLFHWGLWFHSPMLVSTVSSISALRVTNFILLYSTHTVMLSADGLWISFDGWYLLSLVVVILWRLIRFHPPVAVLVMLLFATTIYLWNQATAIPFKKLHIILLVLYHGKAQIQVRYYSSLVCDVSWFVSWRWNFFIV